MDGLYMIFRWIHFMAGIVWIGLLYYFNFVQGSFFNETDTNTKGACVRQLVPRALWWFRWGAAYTFFSGLLMLGIKGHLGGFEIYSTSWGVWILTGTVLGSIMAYNVWFVIWPSQKVVIQSAVDVASGKPANPDAAARGARAAVASRTNTLFSIPLLFFMGAASHLPLAITETTNFSRLSMVLAILIGLIEVNALKGKTGPMTSVKGVIHCGLGLTVVLYILIAALV